MPVLLPNKKTARTIWAWALLALTIVGWFAAPAQAAFAELINYQGKLFDASDNAVPDDDYNIEFKLYTTSSGGSPIWTETRTGGDMVTITDGLFSVLLGEVDPLTGIDFNQALYLTVNIGGTSTPSWDGEMSPRKQLSAVPAAFVAGTANALNATYATSTFLNTTSATTTNFAATVASTTRITTGTLVVNNDVITDLTGTGLEVASGALRVATSSLGITSSQWTTAASDIYYNTGNVGIGTASPSTLFTVHSSSNVQPLKVQGANTNTIGFGIDNTTSKNWVFYVAGSSNLGGVTTPGTFYFRNATDNTNPFVILPTGQVGIGTTTPAEILSAEGNALISGTTTSSVFSLPDTSSGGNGVISVGGSRFIHKFGGASNAFVGVSSGNLTMSGASGNTGVGQSTLTALTGGDFNTAVGTGALDEVTSGGGNTGVGASALTSVIGGLRNTALGQTACSQVSSGNNNLCIGWQAGDNVSTGSNNIVIGHDIDVTSAGGSNQLNIGNLIFGTAVNGSGTTLSTGNIGIGVTAPSQKFEVDGHINVTGPYAYKIGGLNVVYASSSSASLAIGMYAGSSLTTTAYYNTAVGYNAMTNTTSGAQRNTGIGTNAIAANTTGSSNTGLGMDSIRSNVTGIGNVAVGDSALYSATTTSYNTAVGYYALLYAVGANNVALGYGAGDNLTYGSGNVIIGNNVDAPLTTGSNQLNIGNILFGTAIDGTGTTLSSGSIGIGTTTPGAKFAVNGSGLFGGQVTASSFIGTSSATSTLGGGVNIATGCFAIGGVCVQQSKWTDSGADIYRNSRVAIGTTTISSSTFAVHGNSWITGALRIGTTTNSPVVLGDISGNNRSTGAVDIQASRVLATEVVSASYGTAIGGRNIVSGTYGTAIGYANTVSGQEGFAAGSNNLSQSYGVAIGYSADAAYAATAVGYNNTSQTYGTSLGYNNSAGTFSNSIGYNNHSMSAYYANAIGTSNTVAYSHSAAYGNNNTINQLESLALGNGNSLPATLNTSMSASDRSSIVGFSNQTFVDAYQSASYVAIHGNDNVVYGPRAVVMGTENYVDYDNHSNRVAVGFNNSVSGPYSTFVGSQNTSSGAVTVSVLGYGNSVNASQLASVFGYSNSINGAYGTVAGSLNNVSGNYSTGVGHSNTVSGNYASGYGYGNTASGAYSTALGYGNSAQGTSAVALGNRVHAIASGTVAIGFNFSNSIANSLMIGPNKNAAATILSTGEFRAPFFTGTSTATSTFAGGINVTSGCVAVGGTCIVGGGGGGGSSNWTVNGSDIYRNSKVGIGTSTPISNFAIHSYANAAISPYSFVIASSTASATTTQLVFTRQGFLGLGSTTPEAMLSVQGNAAITGALRMGTTTSSPVIIGDISGNTRGTRAIDIQSYRSTSGQVASGLSSLALGGVNTASASYSSAVGYSNSVSGVQASAFGYNNAVSGTQNTALGFNNSASSDTSVAVGASNASGYYSAAVGILNIANAGVYRMAFGSGNNVNGDESTLLGISNNSYAKGTLLAGSNNTVELSYLGAYGMQLAAQTTAVGHNNYVYSGSNQSSEYVSVFGTNNSTYGSNVVVVGNTNAVNSEGRTTRLAVGFSNMVDGDFTSVVGYSNTAGVGSYASILGSSNTTGSGMFNTAVGYNNSSTGDYSSTFGLSNNANTSFAYAAGYANSALNTGATALGYSNYVSAQYSTAVGFDNDVSGINSSAFGNRVSATASGTTAIGFNFTNAIANSLMIGPNKNAAATILSTGEFRAPFFTATSTTGTSTFAGYVGIGTTSPVSMLEVAGKTNLNSGIFDSNYALTIRATGNAPASEGIKLWANNQSQALSVGWGGMSSTNTLLLQSGSGADITLNSGQNTLFSSGNVGVGTSTPGAKFSVTGVSLLAGTTTIIGPLAVAMPTTGAVIMGDITGDARGSGSIDIQVRSTAAQVASGLNSVAVGYKNTVAGVQGVAFGTENSVAGNYAVAAGYYNVANGSKSVALGSENNLGTNIFAVGVGYGNTVSNTYSGAFGLSNTVSGATAFAVGYGLNNSVSNSLMIGPSQSSAATILSTGEFMSPFFTATSTTGTSTFAGRVGIGTLSPGAKLDIVTGALNGGAFRVSTTTGVAPLFYVSATTTGALDYARVAVGTTTTFGNVGGPLLDQFTVAGRIYSTWRTATCDLAGISVIATLVANTANVCGPFAFVEDTDGGMVVMADDSTNYLAIRASTAASIAVGEGAALRSFANHLQIANNPSIEAWARPQGTNAAWYKIGFFLSAADTGAHSTSGVYFSLNATSTNWFAVVRNGTGVTEVDTGIAHSTTNFSKFRIDTSNNAVQFYIDGTKVADVSTNIPTGTSLASGVTVGIPTVGGNVSAVRDFHIQVLRVWVDDPPGGLVVNDDMFVQSSEVVEPPTFDEFFNGTKLSTTVDEVMDGVLADMLQQALAGFQNFADTVSHRVYALTVHTKNLYASAIAILPGGELIVPEGASQVAGSATIPAGSNYVDVIHEGILQSSKIFVTPLDSVESPLIVEKTEGVGFRVRITGVQGNDIPFDWFVIQTYQAGDAIESRAGETVFEGDDTADDGSEGDSGTDEGSGDGGSGSGETEAPPDTSGDGGTTGGEQTGGGEQAPDTSGGTSGGEGAGSESGSSSGNSSGGSSGESSGSSDAGGSSSGGESSGSGDGGSSGGDSGGSSGGSEGSSGGE